MKKPTLCVIFGGKSQEYQVSLSSACEVLTNLNYEKYEVIRLGITKRGEWYIFEGENEEILNDTWEKSKVIPVTLDLSNGHLIAMERQIYALSVDVFFPVAHGNFMEDGRLQGLFDICCLRYVGCSSFSSHTCMDKHLCKLVARQLNIPVARDMLFLKNTPICVDNLSFPLFVKPCMSGSSVGVSRVENKEGLASALDIAFGYSEKVLCEEEIRGTEVEVGVMEIDGEIVVSPVGEIRHGGGFYDYEEKYINQRTKCIIPAEIEEKTEKSLRECAKKLFLALGCRHLCRFDFFLTDRGIIFNEANTMPGFTKNSMFPQLFMQMGYTFQEVLDILIKNATPT